MSLATRQRATVHDAPSAASDDGWAPRRSLVRAWWAMPKPSWLVRVPNGGLVLLAVASAAVYIPLAGVAVALGAVWFALPAAVVFILVGFSVVGVETVLTFVLLLTPLVPSGARLPLLGIRTWQLTLALLMVALVYLVVRAGGMIAGVRIRSADLVFALFELLMLTSFLLVSSADRDPLVLAEQTVLPAAMYAAGRIAFSSARRRRWLMMLTIAAALTAMELWLEFGLGRPLWDSSSYAEWVGASGGLRAGSMLQGPNFTAAFLAVGLGGALAMTRVSGVHRWFVLATCLMLPATFLATRSISGLIEMGAVIGGVLLARGNWAARASVVVVLTVLLIPEVRTQISEQEWFATHGQSITTRFDLFETASRAIQFLLRDPTSILTGLGFGSWSRFAAVFVVGSNIPLTPGGSTTLENTYLTLLFEAGLPAAVLYCTLIGISIWNGWRHRADHVRLAGCLAGVVLTLASGSGTLTSIPQLLGLGLFVLAAANSPDPRRIAEPRPAHAIGD